ncbi:hypothetical protein K501DRAFT_282879 [Backusella circina FSU 941]|nr:hypothetical protein K501DRAFT_282879 [Backusella circina FSU 941]
MKTTFYLLVTLVALVMMVSAAPSKKTCHKVTDLHAKSVCKKFCGKTGYLLGECGDEGICVCTKKVKVTKEHKKSSVTKKHVAPKKASTKKHATKKSTTTKK